MRREKFVFYPHVSLLQRSPQWVHLKPNAKWLPVRPQPRSQVLSPRVGEDPGDKVGEDCERTVYLSRETSLASKEPLVCRSFMMKTTALW